MAFREIKKIRECSENMRIQDILEYGIEVYIGQLVTVEGQLLQLFRPRNPRGFDQFQFLRSRGIQYTMFPRLISAGEVNQTLQGHLYNIRNRLESVQK